MLEIEAKDASGQPQSQGKDGQGKDGLQLP